MIPFNKPYCGKTEQSYIAQALEYGMYSGDGEFIRKCNSWFLKNFGTHSLLVTSCTGALEMAAILCDIKPGDEVIMPSFTYVSTANAFVRAGAKIKFIDIRPDTLNMDEKLIEPALTELTRAIVPVHYGGVACKMDEIMKIAHKYNLMVVEDSAAGIMSKFKNQYLGTIGDVGCISLHETKNIQCGEGGVLLVNNDQLMERAEILRFKGTNRKAFMNGIVDKYTWVDTGSNYAMNEISAAFLFAQLENSQLILDKRKKDWNLYHKLLIDCDNIEMPVIPDVNMHNAHVFYLKAENKTVRDEMIRFLRSNGILSVFHYIPLHTSPAGQKYGTFCGEDKYTTTESERLLRLPMFYTLTPEEIDYICGKIKDFFKH